MRRYKDASKILAVMFACVVGFALPGAALATTATSPTLVTVNFQVPLPPQSPATRSGFLMPFEERFYR